MRLESDPRLLIARDARGTLAATEASSLRAPTDIHFTVTTVVRPLSSRAYAYLYAFLIALLPCFAFAATIKIEFEGLDGELRDAARASLDLTKYAQREDTTVAIPRLQRTHIVVWDCFVSMSRLPDRYREGTLPRNDGLKFF